MSTRLKSSLKSWNPSRKKGPRLERGLFFCPRKSDKKGLICLVCGVPRPVLNGKYLAIDNKVCTGTPLLFNNLVLKIPLTEKKWLLILRSVPEGGSNRNALEIDSKVELGKPGVLIGTQLLIDKLYHGYSTGKYWKLITRSNLGTRILYCL